MEPIKDKFKVIELQQSYDLLKHYSNTHYGVLKTFISIYLAVWGGYILLLTNQKEYLVNYLLIIGMVALFLMNIIFAGIRYYFLVMLKRIEFLKDNFLFVNKDFWADYPKFYPALGADGQPTGEEHKIFRLRSTSILTMIIVCLGNAALFHQLNISDSLDGWMWLPSIGVFILHVLFLYWYLNYLGKGLNKRKGAEK